MSEYNERITLTKSKDGKYHLELDEHVFTHMVNLIYSSRERLIDKGYHASANDVHDLWQALIDAEDALED